MSTSADGTAPPVDGRCDQCGFDYDDAAPLDRLRDAAAGYPAALASAEVRRRPDQRTWSALEYACHVRDVLVINRGRIEQTLAEDHPTYVPMDRDRRVVDDDYNGQDPVAVGTQVVASAEQFVAAGIALTSDQLLRTGLYNYPEPTTRSLDWLLHHIAHEVVHHLDDVRRGLSA